MKLSRWVAYSLLLLIALGFVYFNNFILRISSYEMNEQTYEFQLDSEQATQFAGLTNRLNLSILRFDDYYEQNQDLLSYETRTLILENTSSDESSFATQADWDIKLFKDITHSLLDESAISLEERIEFFNQLSTAFFFLRVRDYEIAVIKYSEMLEKDSTVVNLFRVPILIFRGYSLFMKGNVQASLEDLFEAKEFHDDLYNPTIYYMLDKIYKILALRGKASNEVNDLRRGIFLFKSFDLIEAETILSEYIANPSNPNRDDALYYLGRIQEELGNFDLANRIFEYLKKEPSSDFNTAAIVRLYIISEYHTGDIEGASIQLDALIELKAYSLVAALQLSHASLFDSGVVEGKRDRMAAITDKDLLDVYSASEEEERLREIEEALLLEQLTIAVLSPEETPPSSTVTEESLGVTTSPLPPVVSNINDIVLIPEPTPRDSTLPMLTEQEIIELKIEQIEIEIAAIAEKLDTEKNEKEVRDTVAIVSYSGGTIGAGIAAYQGYQLYQAYNLINGGSIDPATIQSINGQLDSTILQLSITGGLSLAAFLLGGGLSTYDALNETDKNIEMIESTLQLLELEQQALKDQLD